VPDLLGKGARASLVALRRAGLIATLSGSGAVSEQTPEPGSAVEPGALVQLVLRRPVPAKRVEQRAPAEAPAQGTMAQLDRPGVEARPTAREPSLAEAVP
jgi:hypothetical protein